MMRKRLKLTPSFSNMLSLFLHYWINYTISLIVFVVTAIALSLNDVDEGVTLVIALITAIYTLLRRYARSDDTVGNSYSKYRVRYLVSLGRMGSIDSNDLVHLIKVRFDSILVFIFVCLGVYISINLFIYLLELLIDFDIFNQTFSIGVMVYIIFNLIRRGYIEFIIDMRQPLVLRVIMALINGILWIFPLSGLFLSLSIYPMTRYSRTRDPRTRKSRMRRRR